MKRSKDNFIDALRYLSCIIVILMGIFAILGSSGDDDDDDGDSDGSASLTITGSSGAQVALNGNWDGECQMDTDGDSFTMSLTISGASYSVTRKEWPNTNSCSGTPLMVVAQEGAFNLGEEVTATLKGYNVTATVVDNTFDSVKMTVNSEAMVESLNERQFCGSNDWVAGEPKEILGTECGSKDTIKDLAYIDDLSDPDLFYMGNSDSPIDTNGYPTEIDSSTAVSRD